MTSGHELVQQDERLLDARGEARGPAPGSFARRLGDRGQTLADRHHIDRPDRCRDLHVEAVGRADTPGRRFGHGRSASQLARREDRDFIESSDFRASIHHGSL